MSPKLSAEELERLGYDWPKYVIIEDYCVKVGDKIDLSRTIEAMGSSKAYYQKRLQDAFNFKMQSGADYSDFTDRFDEYARKKHDLGTAISYLEKIIEAASGLAA